MAAGEEDVGKRRGVRRERRERIERRENEEVKERAVKSRRT